MQGIKAWSKSGCDDDAHDALRRPARGLKSSAISIDHHHLAILSANEMFAFVKVVFHFMVIILVVTV
jgi:hypothetical protein